jgi:hypothetical protein
MPEGIDPQAALMRRVDELLAPPESTPEEAAYGP